MRYIKSLFIAAMLLIFSPLLMAGTVDAGPGYQFIKTVQDNSACASCHEENTLSNIIKPTVGRIVLYHPSDNDMSVGMACNDKNQPMAAKVAYVWNDRMVNLSVSDHNGNVHARTSVTLVQPGDEAPPSYYCEWMPYQKGQAAKTEELESKLASVSETTVTS